jgi:hypothetical protein
MEWKYDIVIEIIKSNLDIVVGTGRSLLLGFLPLAIIITYLGVLRNKSSWLDLFLRVVIGFIILGNYESWMDTIRNITVSIINTVTPEDFISQYKSLVESFQQKYAEQQASNPWEAIQNFIKNSATTFLINLSFLFYSIATFVMNTVRYVFAALLYKIGPLLVPFILFSSTVRILGGWLTSYISVLFWPLLWRIMMSIAVDQGQNIPLTAEGILSFTAFNLAVAGMVIFSPVIITSIAAGLGAGIAGSLAGAFATKGAFDILSRAGQGAVQGTAGAISGAAKSVQGIMGQEMLPLTFGGMLLGTGINVSKVFSGATAGTFAGITKGIGVPIEMSDSERTALQPIRNFMYGHFQSSDDEKKLDKENKK